MASTPLCLGVRPSPGPAPVRSRRFGRSTLCISRRPSSAVSFATTGAVERVRDVQGQGGIWRVPQFLHNRSPHSSHGGCDERFDVRTRWPPAATASGSAPRHHGTRARRSCVQRRAPRRRRPRRYSRRASGPGGSTRHDAARRDAVTIASVPLRVSVRWVRVVRPAARIRVPAADPVLLLPVLRAPRRVLGRAVAPVGILRPRRWSRSVSGRVAPSRSRSSGDTAVRRPDE